MVSHLNQPWAAETDAEILFLMIKPVAADFYQPNNSYGGRRQVTLRCMSPPDLPGGM
jgi:hypothetical protein